MTSFLDRAREAIASRHATTKAFREAWAAIAADVHKNALEKGFWDASDNDAEKLALMHSELSEALEALREGNPRDAKCPDFSSLEVELADVVIRIMDYAARRNLDVAGAIVAKIDFNRGRPKLHGKKF